MPKKLSLTFHPLTQKLWRDFEILVGPRGACAGCWCMHWKLRGPDFERVAGDKARQMQKAIVDSGAKPGLVAYYEGYPVGWVAVEPRSHYLRLAHSPILKPVDDQEVWSITCLFVDKKHRNKGISVQLIKAAVEYAGKHGAKILEGYPKDTDEEKQAASMFTGKASSFKKAGFKEVARRKADRPIFRFVIR